MSTSRIFPGIAMVGEYQKSGTPFCTASNSTEVNSTTTTQISFPRVTRWVEITPYVQSGAAYLKVAFTQNGINETGAVAGHIVIGEKTNAAGAVVDDTIQTLHRTLQTTQRKTHRGIAFSDAIFYNTIRSISP